MIGAMNAGCTGSSIMVAGGHANELQELGDAKMSQKPSPYQTSSDASRSYSAPAVGLTLFAGIMMVMAGSFQVVAGVASLLNDAFSVSTRSWLFQPDATRWGWIHLALGAVLIGAGIALFGGLVWARTVAVILAVVSAVANFAWLPVYPAWGLIMIALDVSIIWAVTVHGRDIARV